MLQALAGLCSRADNAGVTSFVRVLNFRAQAYHRFLHLFHSDALDLDVLSSCWARLCLRLFRPFEVGSRLVLLADGIKRELLNVDFFHLSEFFSHWSDGCGFQSRISIK